MLPRMQATTTPLPTSAPPVGRQPGSPAIAAQHLTKFYGTGRRRARGVIDITFEVQRGEVFGFVGPNGAGKTTTIRLLLDLLRPTTGRAEILGFDTRAASIEVHRRVGFLPGGPAFFERLTGREHLEWIGRLRGGVPGAVIDTWADRFGLDLSKPIHSLSRGNRQKIAVIQAFMHDPELVLLDEPTSGLDPLVQQTFHEIVREVVADGRTVFLSSHVLDEVEHLCDRVGVIREGRLVAIEDVDALRSRAVREVRIRFRDAVDPAPFRLLPGVTDVRSVNGAISLRASGDLDPLVKLAARYPVTDFVSAPVELDEVFLDYYRPTEVEP